MNSLPNQSQQQLPWDSESPQKSSEEIRDHCPHCGQSLGYKSSVSRGVVSVLKTMWRAIGQKGINAIHIEKELVQKGALTGNQGRNCIHMTKLGLIAHIKDEPGNYCITTKGADFLNGKQISKSVTVKKRTESEGSRTIEQSEEMCTIHDFQGKGEYWEIPGFEIREGRIIPPKIDIDL